MHVVFREAHGLDAAGAPVDLGHDPADLIVMSFSDSDLGTFAAGWRRADGALPSLRLVNLARLSHPLSVDTYVERTLVGAKGILVRLIGGIDYWAYGIRQVEALARARGLALAVLPADGRRDTRLEAASTLPVSTLHQLAALCDTGGPVAAQAALAQMALAAGLYAGPVAGTKALGAVGGWTPEGVMCPAAFLLGSTRPRIVLTFYRAYVSAADTEPFEALAEAFAARGMDVIGLFTPSLKAPEAAAWIRRWVSALRPEAVVNATAFSARDGAKGSPLDAAGVPVFQIALATSTQAAWAEASRGLSPADLAMHVVLPEVDGRLFAGAASFKQAGDADDALQFSRIAHRAEPRLIMAIAERVLGWARLRQTPAADKRVALVLSTYPGKAHQMAHAVGLDALASAEAVLADMAQAGYRVSGALNLSGSLETETLVWSVHHYVSALEALPEGLRADLAQAWGAPDADPSVADGAFRFAAVWRGSVLVALQPERGEVAERSDLYHDLRRTPRHGYVAFYLWLRALGIDALVHVGAHGTLEWLPGKAVALSEACWPEALTGAMPVIYPFIVNDPGEAAQAKRRIGAVTLGHAPPPLRRGAGLAGSALLETLLDEFSTADGLDPARRNRLIGDIRSEAQALGLEADLALDNVPAEEALARIDRFVCDVKETQFGDGLHVFGRADAGDPSEIAALSAAGERAGLLEALSGGRVEPGPSGSPWRGRTDVLPTGRNMFTTDPRAVPSRAAQAQGVRLADELLRRHLQDHGEYPKGLIVDLWGSATMRTGGEEFGMALHLMGVTPLWDEGSERVSGIGILPLALLDRPRIDVTLRVSGLFRDVFPVLSGLFDQAVRTLCARDEAADWNPFAGRSAGARVYGPAPSQFGLGMGDAVEDYTAEGRTRAGEAWLAGSDWEICGETTRPDRAGIEARLRQADAFVHPQDLPETDLLLAADYASHEAGFAAAQRLTGGSAALYHLDATNPEAPRARTLREEIARVVRGRAANPAWVAGMMRHRFRGGAEIAATLDHLAAFAHLAGVVEPHLFDLYHDATLGRAEVRTFLEAENPGACAAMEARFRALHASGLWRSRRNSIVEGLA